MQTLAKTATRVRAVDVSTMDSDPPGNNTPLVGTAAYRSVVSIFIAGWEAEARRRQTKTQERAGRVEKWRQRAGTGHNQQTTTIWRGSTCGLLFSVELELEL